MLMVAVAGWATKESDRPEECANSVDDARK